MIGSVSFDPVRRSLKIVGSPHVQNSGGGIAVHPVDVAVEHRLPAHRGGTAAGEPSFRDLPETRHFSSLSLWDEAVNAQAG